MGPIDAEMLDADADEEDVDDGDSLSHDRLAPAGFVTRGPGFGLPLSDNALASQEDGSEGDGSRSASAEGVMSVLGIIPETEPIISGKRKR
jgi:hypothetical protein